MAMPSKISRRLFYSLLLPSLLSGSIAAILGIIIFLGPYLLLHYGSTAQEGYLGLNIAYNHSSLTTVSHTVSMSFLGNQYVGHTVFIAFWGAVGLVIYLLVFGMLHRMENFLSLVSELGYAHVVRHQYFIYHIVRSLLRILAVIAWCLLLPFFIYKLIPYGIATAQISALHSVSVKNWLFSVLICGACILTIHALTVFLRLMVLRPRLFGESPVLYEE
jgi:hypothetical protein